MKNIIYTKKIVKTPVGCEFTEMAADSENYCHSVVILGVESLKTKDAAILRKLTTPTKALPKKSQRDVTGAGYNSVETAVNGILETWKSPDKKNFTVKELDLIQGVNEILKEIYPTLDTIVYNYSGDPTPTGNPSTYLNLFGGAV